MDRTAGIALVDLFEIADTVNSVLPKKVRDFIGQFVVIGHETSHSDGAIFHHGVLQAIATSVDEIPTEFYIGIGRLSVPLIQTGIPFQLAFQRSAGSGNLEGSADVWRLDLSLDVLNLTVDYLQPAIYVPETGTTPRHLVRDPTRSEVRITGSAVLRIEQPAAGAPVAVKFIDRPDPLDPIAVSGAVATLICSPPHFFISGSEYGLSVGRLTFDFSDSFSPPEIIERNQGPSWTGLAIQEATFYAPRNLPGIGDMSGGVKNLLIGSPLGLQGEIEVQFGRTALSPSAFNFEQVTDEGNQPLGISGSGTARRVQIEASEDEDVTVHAGFVSSGPPDPEVPADGLVEWSAEWRWNGGALQTGDASSGTVRHGQTLTVTPIEIVRVGTDESDFRHPEITFRFAAGGDAPAIGVTVGTQSFDNVTHIGGTREALSSLTLNATSGGGSNPSFEWEIDGVPQRHSGASFTLDPKELTGIQTVILREKTKLAGGGEQVRLARARLHTLGSGALLIGCEDGVFDATDASTRLALAAVEGTFDLSDFHADGSLLAKREQAEINATDRSVVDVPADGLAMVTIAPPPPSTPPAPPATDRHIQVLMDFDTVKVVRWGSLAPEGANDSFSQAALLTWAARYPGAKFIVVGRCDDIGSDSYNASLATQRADRGRTLLSLLQPGETGTPVPSADIYSRGEQNQFTGASAAGDAAEENAQPPMRLTELSEAADSSPANGRLIHADIPASLTWRDRRDDTHEDERDDFRRIDIYAIGGTPTADATLPDDNATVGAALRRSLVPAPGRDPAAVPPGSPAMDYRVKLRIVWDSPTVNRLSDAIPTLAEAEFAWTPQQAPLPQVGGDDVELSREVLTVFVNWTHDSRTGYTKAALGIRSEGDPDGLISTTTKPLVTALAFGPALLSGVNADTDLIGSGARIAALLGAVAFSEADLGGGPLVGDGSKAALTSAAFETEMRSIADPAAAMQVRVVTDYVCTLHINGGVLGIKTAADKPMKIRYKRVGLQYDTAKTGWERFGLVYDTTSMEIEDPGRWEIDGVLGSLLRIVEVAMGRGSVWIEGRIAIALEIGIIEISEAIIRLTFRDGVELPEFELRGFVLKADIPQVLKGEGRLRIEDGGLIRAGVDAELIPLGLGVEAALALGMPPEIAPSVFLSLYLGVQFSTPLPLAQSGMAIYGFKGLFVMNGQRKLPANSDPVGRELQWWRTPPEQKYEPHKDQFALGVGVVVGTLPDVSFCVSCAGMVVVAFPDPEVILGVDVKIVEVPDKKVTDKGGASGAITGLIVIDEEAVKLAVSAQYTIPSVLEVKAPFSGFFPYPGSGKDVYVRIGSDGQTAYGRFGEPVTLTLLPGTIDVKAWTYLMIEQGGLPNLGGDPRFSFDGFAVGFGAGFEIRWSAGPIKLEASAKVLIGFGTAPLLLMGGIFVRGELDLVVISISAHGELILEARQIDPEHIAIRIKGKFCGEVDLFFFSISGCVGVNFDFSPDLTPPAPPSPVRGISLTDRRDRIMGVCVGASGTLAAQPAVVVPADASDPAAVAAAAAASVGVNANNTVWPDTAPVIHFSHYVENAMPTSAQFTPGPTPTQPKWTGSSQLKYAYRLDSVRLIKHGDGSVVASARPLQSVWTSTPYRQPDASGVDNPLPSEHEGPNLKLLDWNPWAWVVNMSNGGAGQPGAPADTVGTLCDPKPLPARACVLGRDARHAGLNAVRLRQQTPAPGPYPSRFFVTGEPVLRAGSTVLRGTPLMTLLGLSGSTLVPGAVVDLPFAVTEGSDSLTHGYRLPALRRTVSGTTLAELALPWEGLFDQPVTDPVVTLIICDAFGNGRPDDSHGDDGNGGERLCDDFRGLKTRNKVREVVRQGFRVLPLHQKETIDLVDQLDTSVDPLVPSRDGSAELRLPDGGVAIQFHAAVRAVELHVVLFASGLKARALDAAGREIASDFVSPPGRRAQQVLRLRGAGIAVVELLGGANEALLYKVCVEGAGSSGKTCEAFEGLKPTDKSFERVAYHGFICVPIKKGEALRLTDAVDQRTLPPRRGGDGHAEIFFPAGGMRVTLPHACPEIELHLMVFTNAGFKVVGFNAAGRTVAGEGAAGPQGAPIVVTLRAKETEAIAALEIHGGGGEALLYKICCPGNAAEQYCVDFDELDRPARKVARLVHAGIVFESASGKPELALVDMVDEVAEPDRSGRDQRRELRFPGAGLRIELPAECRRVELDLMLFVAGPLQAHALDATGARVWRGETPKEPKQPVHLDIRGRGIRTIELFGAQDVVALYHLCHEPEAGPAIPDEPVPDECNKAAPIALSAPVAERAHAMLARANAVAAVTPQAVVTGIVGEQPHDNWDGALIEQHEGRDGRRCALLRFRPQAGALAPWNGFRIQVPPGKTVTLVSVCGIDQRAADARATDATVQANLLGVLATVMALPPEERREIVLEPATQYDIEIGWSWQVWQPENPNETPPEPDPGAWTPGSTDRLRFATAPVAGATPAVQDGLNEYIFDARDVGRYLIGVEPSDGRAMQFTDDPIWAHFEAGHVKQLLEQYGRTLAIEIRRTDPKPQSTPAALVDVLAPLAVSLDWLALVDVLQPVGYQLINTALQDAPCLPDGAPMGGASVAVVAALEPEADYDLNVVANKGSDRAVVLGTRFRTSRYASPRAMVDALGYEAATPGLFLPDDLIVPADAVLPAGGFVEGDAAFDVALAAIDAETLALPESEPKSYVLWRFDSATMSWHIEGLLVDSLEPMKRELTVIVGGAAQNGVRIAPASAAVGARTMTLYRANSRWTRVLFRPAAAFALAVSSEHTLRLNFTTPQGAVSGSRRLLHRPSLLEREDL